MQLEHSFTVPVSVDEAWAVLLDIERVAPCMPGAAIDTIDGDDFTGTVKVKLGPIALTYKGKASFVEKDEAGHRVAINAQGRDQRGNGTAAAKVTATLQQDGDRTKVDVVTDLDITGKPAQFGRGVMVDVGNKLIGQFADCLAAKIGDAAPPEPAAESAAAAPAAQPATEPSKKAAKPAKAATKTATKKPAAKAAPKPAAKAATRAAAKKTAVAESTSEAAAAAAPDSATQPSAAAEAPAPDVAARPAPRKIAQPEEVEPINLIESAGPAVAKRLAPVLAALVLLLIVLRRLRRS